VGVADWNWRHQVELQDVPWDCAAASTAWAMQACGHQVTEADVVAGLLAMGAISPTYGLMDASGAGLVAYLATQGITAENNASASWADVQAAAGYQPMVIGGRAWCHWSGLRMGTWTVETLSGVAPDVEALALANPAPGWMGVGQILLADQFAQLGSFSAVWFTSW